jgi:hypothetical protein
MDGPTTIVVVAKEPSELKPYTGGADVVIRRYSVKDFNSNTGEPNFTEIASGKTDSSGKYAWSGNAPSPNADYKYRIEISPGIGQAKRIDVPARSAADAAASNGQRTIHEVVVPVCPSNVDPIICAVADARLDMLTIKKQQTVIEPPGPHMMLKHPRLMAHWTFFKWWVSDEGIQPKEWPVLVKNYEQLIKMFDSIPFPKMPEAEDLWVRCARGVPIWKGHSVADPRLYVSDYFPREDYQIEVDMAFEYLTNVPATVACMVDKLAAHARKLAKRATTFKMLGVMALVMLAPLSGGASMALLATEAGELTYSQITDRPTPGTVSTLVTGGVSLASSNPDALGNLISAGLSALMENLGEGLDPIVKQIIAGALPMVVKAAVGDVLSGSTTVTASSVSGAADFISLASLGSAAAGMAIKLVSNLITAQGVRGVKDFKKTVLGMQDLHTLMIPFALWAINVLFLDKLFEYAAQQAALEQGVADDGTAPELPPGDVPIGDLNTEQHVVDPLLNDAVSQGVEVPPTAIAQRPPVLEASPPLSTAGSVAGLGGAALALLLVTEVLS